MAPKRPDQVIEELYPSVMKEVIAASLIEFEDAGISRDVLDELKSLWEKNLTDTKVGHFPWSPALPVSVPVKLEFDDPSTSRFANFQRSETTLGQGGQQQAHGSESRNILGAPLQQGLHLAGTPAASLTAGLQHYQSGVPLYNPGILRQSAQAYGLPTTSLTAGLQHNQSGASLYDPEISRQRAQAYLFQRQQRVQPVIAAQTILERIKAASLLHNSHQQQTVHNPCQQEKVQNLPNGQSSGSQIVPVHPREPEKYVPGQNHAAHSYTGYQPSTRPYTAPPKQLTPNPPQLDGPSDSSPSDNLPPTIILSPPVEFTVTEEEGGADDSPNDADDSSSAGEEFEEVPELLVCLYDKVSKSRNKAMHKWKCQFRGGVLVMGEKEYVFARANAELTW